MTAADHANTIREALNIGPLPDSQSDRDKLNAGHDAVDALQAQAEAVGLELDVANQEHERAEAAEAERDDWHRQFIETFEKLGQVEAECDRLADALRDLASMPGRPADLMVQISRAALAETEHTP